MTSIDQTIRELEEIQQECAVSIQHLRSIKAKTGGGGGSSYTKVTGVGASKPRRQMSPEAKRRISEAQRARHQKAEALAQQLAPESGPKPEETTATAIESTTSPEVGNETRKRGKGAGASEKGGAQ